MTKAPAARQRAQLAAEQAAARRREQRVLVAVLVTVVAVVVGGGIALQAWRTARAPAAVPSVASSQSPVAIAASQPIVLGSAQAPVKVSLYEDFHCPHCADFEEEFGPSLTAAQDEGLVRVELYPMSFIDEGSARAANAMACAAEAGFGQSYYLGLFANHTLQWNDSQLVQLASKVGGAATPDFSSCVANRSHAAWVDSINATASANGVSGTPTMFLNDQPVDLSSLTVPELERQIAAASR